MLKTIIPSEMTKKQKKILNEIASELNLYLLDGNLTSFIKNFTPDLKIRELKRLLRIHFVLTKRNNHYRVGVIDFIEKLSQRLRRIKTTITPKTEILDGNIKGRISWQRTSNYRNRFYPSGDTLFVCQKREKNYDISENIVLKKLV